MDPTTHIPQRAPFLLLAATVALGALLLIGVSVFILADTCLPRFVYWETRSWVPCPATVTQLEWRDINKKGEKLYEFRAEYVYAFGGRPFTGDRINGLLRNAGGREYSRRQYDALLECKQTGRPATAFVDPDDPTRSILFREPPPFSTWGLMLGMGMMFFGLPIAGLAVSLVRARARLRKVLREHGEKWWLMRRDWERMQAKPCVVRVELAAVTFFLSVGMMLGPGVWTVVLLPPVFVVLWMPLATAVALVLGIGALTAIRRAALGIPVLYLHEVPVVPGQEVTGTLRLCRRLCVESVRMRLVCRVTHRTGFKAEGERWRRHHFVKYTAPIEPAGEVRVGPGMRTTIPLVLQVPDGQPETVGLKDANISWHVLVEGRLQLWGIPLAEDLQLPVYNAKPEDVIRCESSGEDGLRT